MAELACKDNNLPTEFHDGVFDVIQVARGTSLEQLVGVDLVHMGPGRQSNMHRHGTAVLYITEGSGEILVTERQTVVPVTKGDRIVIPGRTYHAVRTLEEGLAFLSVQSPPILDLSSGVLDLEWLLPKEERDKRTAVQMAKLSKEERDKLASLQLSELTLKDSAGRVSEASRA